MAGFALPLPGSYAREMMGDLAHVVEVLDRRNIARLPEFSRAVSDAMRTMASAPKGAIRSVTVICLRSNDERWLIQVGPRGGWKRLWNFGKG